MLDGVGETDADAGADIEPDAAGDDPAGDDAAAEVDGAGAGGVGVGFVVAFLPT